MHGSLEKNTENGVPSPIRLTLNGDGGELPINHKFVWEKIMTEYIKEETKLNEDYQKSYMLIFGKCTNNISSKLEAQED